MRSNRRRGSDAGVEEELDLCATVCGNTGTTLAAQVKTVIFNKETLIE